MSNFAANGSVQAFYLRMSSGSIQWSVGTRTTPGTFWQTISYWPVSIYNSDPTPGPSKILNVFFTENLTISDTYGGTDGYFQVYQSAPTSYVTFDGAGYTININNISSYPGFIRNGQSGVNGKDYIGVQNLTANVSSGSLAENAGWLCQAYFGKGALSNSVTNCSSNGRIQVRGGGLAGSYVGSCGIAPGYAPGSITFTSCTSSGELNNSSSTNGSGGLVGVNAGSGGGASGRLGSATFINCTSTARMNQLGDGGGIAGSSAGENYGSATFTNCTFSASSFSDILDNCGGIVGSYAGAINGNVTITNCSVTAATIRRYGGGFCGAYTADSNGNVTISGCTNNIDLTFGSQGSGGFCGWRCANNGGSVNIIDCTNNGAITGSYSGGFIGEEPLRSGGTLTFTNCVNNGRIDADQVSGFVSGRNYSGTGSYTFTNCTNNGINRSEGGGMITSGNASASLTLTGCRNTGNIAGSNGGGLIGSNSVFGTAIITNCTNTGNIIDNGDSCGGIAGRSFRATSGSFTNCTNSGNMTKNNCGGIVGAECSTGATYVTTFTNCSNTGQIGTDTSGTSGSNGQSAGGITGFRCAQSGGVAYFINCTNSGAINGRVAGGLGGNNIGYGGSAYFTSCINTGIIRGEQAGGITGGGAGQLAGGTASLINCVNTGDINSTASIAGGIVGNAAANTTITRCYNTGAIAGPSSGGIAAANFGSSATRDAGAAITSCYTTGAISGTNAGGIASSSVGSSTYTASITNCYSLGNISAGCGGIVFSCAASNRLTISNCYSFGTVGTTGSGIVASGQTQPLSLVNCYVANNSWSDATANASLTGYPTGIGIATGQATTWTSISANIPYLLSTFFSLAGNRTAQQIYTPDGMVITLNESSAPGYYQPGVYSIANTSQAGNTLTTNVYVVGGTTPKYLGYGYTTYSLTNANGSSSKPIAVTINATTGVLSFVLPFPCFLEGTKILCFENNKEVYRPVESLRKGDLVKTIYNGYLPIHKIGTSPMYNPSTDDRISDRLYKCSKENYPALFEDLYITGCHSILVPSLTYLQGLITKASLGKLYVTDKHCRLMAWVDEKAQPYTREGIYNIYHIALENSDYYMNYGIYANGLLVESCSKRYLTEMSNMRLLGEEDSSVTEDESSPPETIFPKMTTMVEIC